MKQGKKIIAMMLMLVITSVSLCGMKVEAKELTAQQILKKSASTSSKIKSFTSTAQMTVQMKNDKKSQKVQVTQKMNYIKNPLKIKCQVITQTQGQKQKTTSYYSKKGSKYYQYDKVGGAWKKSQLASTKIKEIKETNPAVQLKNTLKYLKNAKIKNKNAKVSGRSAYLITATISVKEMYQDDENSIYLPAMEGKEIVVKYWIDKKTYYPLKYSIDMKEWYQALLDSLSESEKITISKYSMTTTYTKINKTSSFKLPSGAE